MMQMKWEIRYYLTENLLHLKKVSFKEVVVGNWDYAVKLAELKKKNTNFKYYEIVQVK